jgi:aminoglycoside phosphotransferase (APT) family kinase protein
MAPVSTSALEAGIDLPRLHDWLRQHADGFDGGLRIEPLPGGQSNPTHVLHTPQQRYVLRCKPGPAAQLLRSAHAIEREYRVMAALYGHGVPVPRMVALCEDESVIGRAFYVMQFVEGRVLWDPALPGQAPAERAALYDEMNRVIAALHGVDPAAVGLADFGRPQGYIARQIDRWSRQYRASETVRIEAMEALMCWLPAHLPASAQDGSRVAIVHGDFRLDNLLLHPTEPRVLAVLDWELSTLGHPLADLAYHCMPRHIPAGLFRSMGGVDPGPLGIPDEAAYLQTYCARMADQGVHWDVDRVRADWPFYIAFNLFRMAAILQGIARRAVDGTAADADAQRTGAIAIPMAEVGWTLAQRHMELQQAVDEGRADEAADDAPTERS